MKALLFYIPLFTCFIACNSRQPSRVHTAPGTNLPVGGGCDGCELMYVGMPAVIPATDTSAGWKEAGQQLLISGTVVGPDGHPMPGVIIYYWQTDHTGHYSPSPGLDPKARRHGHIRGWMKTGPDGRYALYTIRPAPYPNDSMPAHIHLSIKEPAIANEYYIDEWVFDDDPFLTPRKRAALENRGGPGILKPILLEGKLVAEQNIFPGKNIPGYPVR